MRNSTSVDPIYSYHASIHHDGSPRYICSPYQAGLQIGDLVTIRLRTAQNAPLERLLLRFCPDGEQQFVEMQTVDSPENAACRWWQATLRLDMPVTLYRFLLFAQDGVWWYNGTGLHRSNPTDAEDFRLLAGYPAPTWVHNSVFYQIFPDRFADGDSSNNVHDGEYEYRSHLAHTRKWGEPAASSGHAAMVEFFGGDLPGIEQRLDYLQDLGVNALYINPIFSAYSNHRYDVTDYYQVDPHLGGNTALATLRTAMQERGMHLILDIVPNHCGWMHPWFQAALKDPAAPSAEFFTFHHHPDEYACWLGMRSLPKLNYRSQALRQVMYAAPDAIFRGWLRPPYAIDGWRLDVANMLARQGTDQLGIEVGRGIHQAVKQENPQAYLLGENFFDGSSQLQGDMWDATMNYSGFTMPLWYWLNRFQIGQHSEPHNVASDVPWSTQALVDTWAAYRAAIPWTIARQQFNPLGSHDTARILTTLQGNMPLNRLAVGLLMTYPGAPSVYYGDEIGMSGDGLLARGCMLWDEPAWNAELRAFYKALIHLRRTSPALIDGGFQMLLVEENTLAYLRDSDEEQIIVIAQRGPGERPANPLPVAQAAIPDGTPMTELFSRRQATVTNGYLPLAAMMPGIEVWKTGD